MEKSYCFEIFRRVLRKTGYRGRNRRRKPFACKVNPKKRIGFAKGEWKPDRWILCLFFKVNLRSTVQIDTKNVLRNQSIAWTKEQEKNCETWRWFDYGLLLHSSCYGCWIQIIMDSMMNRYSYMNRLKGNICQSASKLGLQWSCIYQQDNDLKHTARSVDVWLFYNAQKFLRSHLILIPLNFCRII